MVEIVAIRADEVESIWSDVESQIKSALAYTGGEIDSDTIKKGATNSEIQIFAIVSNKVIIASITAEIIKSAIGNICHIITCGGSDIDSWLDDWVKLIQPIAKEQNCKKITISGRRGWVKKLQGYGYKHTYSTVELIL